VSATDLAAAGLVDEYVLIIHPVVLGTGIPFWPEGLDDCTGLPLLCDQLRKRGFSSKEVDRIAGGNLLRILQDVVG